MKRVLLSLGLLICFSMVSFGQEATKAASAKDSKPTDPNAPEIAFAELSHDFGTLFKGDPCAYVFNFKNTGKEPLILSNCQASCGCTTPSCPKEPIAPGASGVIKVKYDSNRVGVFSKTITIKSNAKNSSVVLSIKGKIEGPSQNEPFPGTGNTGM